jgi:hypothetical protein
MGGSNYFNSDLETSVADTMSSVNTQAMLDLVLLDEWKFLQDRGD